MFKEKIGCAAVALAIVVFTSVSVVGCADLYHYIGEKCANAVDCRKSVCEHAPDVCK